MSVETTQHTPTPWFVTHSFGDGSHVRSDSADEDGVVCCAESEADGEFIVTACNSHAQLLAACEAASKAINDAKGYVSAKVGLVLDNLLTAERQARAAIAAAKPKGGGS